MRKDQIHKFFSPGSGYEVDGYSAIAERGERPFVRNVVELEFSFDFTVVFCCCHGIHALPIPMPIAINCPLLKLK